MRFATGSLVRARDREWVVLPGTVDDLVLLRPIGGTDEEITGVMPAVEPIAAASFAWPSAEAPGDHLSASLLRDALRLGFRSSAGPFRSFGSIAVEPRPYQLVPLLMALRQQHIRLLIADAAGTGKTIEAGLIAAEALANGTARRLAVLCPPQLADQWQSELAEKFYLEAELVLPSTAARLERPCAANQSLFDLHENVIVSMDFIKSDRRRDEFLRTCPDLVIVDEAHTCAPDENQRSGRHQRHELIKGLAAAPDRHVLLVTGTPDSGKAGTFRSLVALLDPSLGAIIDDPSDERQRRKLAAHFIQRTRADIDHYLDDETPFPRRLDAEASYSLSDPYRQLFERALAYARESVNAAGESRRHQRVRWWSALALLRSLASSPAAAADTLRKRAGLPATDAVDDNNDTTDIDAAGRHELLDLGDDDATETTDVAVGALADERDDKARRRLLEMARQAERLAPEDDHKLVNCLELVGELLDEGCNPIVFCRYIPTAESVANALRNHLGGRAEVAAITGTVTPAEREARIEQLAEAQRHILVATDCLSEGINLQHDFDAVLHYDLAWGPTKHEQREARVSRFGQRSEQVRIVTYFGRDNQIDGIVLDVLLRKQKSIRARTGVTVAVPHDSGDVMEAILEGLLLRGRTHEGDDQLSFFDAPDASDSKLAALHTDWEDAAERERRSRALYAQHAIRTDEVSRELTEERAAIGGPADVASFVRSAVLVHGGSITSQANGSVEIDLTTCAVPLHDAVTPRQLLARFDASVHGDEQQLTRSHPFVEALTAYVLTNALDELGDTRAARAAATRTHAVMRRTTLLLVRGRYDLITTRGSDQRTLLAEDADVVAFEGAPDNPTWLGPDAVAALVTAQPTGQVPREQAQAFVTRVLDNAERLTAHLDNHAEQRAEALLAAHRRVRSESGGTGVRYRVVAHLPVDVLGVYVLLPAGSET
jgi:hypothetical protein